MSIDEHWIARQGILTMQSAQCGAHPILRLGDSLTGQMWMGLPTNPATLLGNNANVISAGYMGMGVYSLAPYRDYALGICSPWCVLLQIGTNDAFNYLPFDPQAWEAAFEANVVACKAHASVQKVVCLTVPPVKDVACGFDQGRINTMNNIEEAVCMRQGVQLIDLDPYLMCASTGYARPGVLLDAAHLAGGAAWTVAWLEYCACSNQVLGAPPDYC